MPQKKEPTAAQLAARKKFGEQARARAAAKKQGVATPTTPESQVPEQEPVKDIGLDDTPNIQTEQNYDELAKQLKETQETMALLKAALLAGGGAEPQSQPNQNFSVGNGRMVGEVEKYLVDPALYPDPTPRLAMEPRLAPLAFDYNYELDYEVSVTNYETKAGINMKEPRFKVTLYRILLDDQGERVKVMSKDGKLQDKLYIARQMYFHEDPQAAMVIARDNNILIPEEDQARWLNEMRYIRVRDWLFDIFWPKAAQAEREIREEVIGGQLVRTFYRNSEEPGGIPFDKLSNK